MRIALYYIPIVTLFLFFCSCGGDGQRSNRRRTQNQNDNIEQPDKMPVLKPVVNVYLENSGSMDGYVKGVTDFKHAVYSYLSDVKIAGVADTINLFYINSKIIPFGSDIAEFIDKLNPATFKNRGGNRGETDIAVVLKTILDETDDRTVSIFVSDCVFSPGKGKDADEYLVTQRIGIKVNVAELIKKNPNAAFSIYRLTSQFDGFYYNRRDDKTSINNRRPFFIWLIGNVDFITTLNKRIPSEKIRGSGITHSYTLLPLAQDVEYGIQFTPKYGNFKLSREKGKTKTHLLNPEKASKGIHKGEFMFSVGVDFSNLQTLLGKEYLLKSENYSVTVNKQPSEVFSMEIKENNGTIAKYTHFIQLFTTQKIPVGDVEISLIHKEPRWITEVNDEVGLDIKIPGAMDQTYGIKYMTGGVEDAYQIIFNEAKNIHRSYVKLKVNISK